MRHIRRLFLLAAALGLAAACQSPSTLTEAPPASTTSTAAPPTATRPPASPTATPTATATPPPTAAPRPSATPTATLAFSPTPFTAVGARLETDGAAWSVAWSPDGRVIASGGEAGKMNLWDAVTNRRLRNLWIHSGFVESLAFSPDGARLASGSFDSTVIIWDTATGRRLVRLEGHSDFVDKVAWSPDGRFLGVHRSPDPGLLLWDAATWTLQPEVTYAGRLFDIAWSPDSRQVATGTLDDTLLIWDAATGQPVRELRGHRDNVLHVAWSPDGRWLASHSLDERLYLWDVESGQMVRDLPGGRGIFSLTWSPDSQSLAYGSLNGPVIILDAITGAYRYAFNVSALRGLAWSPDGLRLAAATGDGIRVWDLASDLRPSPTPSPRPSATAAPVAATAQATPGGSQSMVFVPGGPFQMGAHADDAHADPDERPQHVVDLAPFWIDMYEVSNTEYAICVATGTCQPPAERDVNGFPYARAADIEQAAVVNVTWNDAQTYCAWAGKRLPTEAEWEKAAHGESWRLYPWGDEEPRGKAWFCDQCIFERNFPDVYDDFSRPIPVGEFAAGLSPHGAYNMAGNVWEWTADWYGDSTYRQPDRVNPRGPESGELRVIRGGGWTSPPEHLRTTYRNAWRPDTAWIDVGFRCARDGE